jgi:bifunctional UDP-N-acetylglucosamine pyrophosphorylase/glucosamine-1-phosphate N-acetyltransferase
VLRAAAATRPERLVVVVSKERPGVAEAAGSWGLRPAPSFVDQGEPLGTGHAVAAAKKATSGAADVLVLAGDDPLVTAGDLRRLLAAHRRRQRLWTDHVGRHSAGALYAGDRGIDARVRRGAPGKREH